MVRILILILLIPFLSFGQLAFPTAVGFGKNATGGRGGTVLFVTNLNDSGAGSLRAAIDATGARTVVFRVGGTIALSSALKIENNDITIAGETAPGGGIMIRNYALQISASNVIVRHLRSRVGTGGGAGQDAFRIISANAYAINDIIVDHCSMSWANDENVGMGVVTTSGVLSNVTVQNSIMGEATYGTLVTHRTYNTSFINNYLAHNTERNIRAGGYSDQAEPQFALRAEFINNIVYGSRYNVYVTYGQKFSGIGNVFKVGPLSLLDDVFTFTTSGEFSGYRPNSDMYLEDNVLIGTGNLEDANVAEYKSVTPFNSSGFSPISASTLPNSLFDNVGAFPLDAVDQRLIGDYTDGGGAASQVYPTLASGTAYTDTDNDGIEDSWEQTQFGNLSQTHLTDFDGDGYTDLEEFLHYKAGDNELKAFPTAGGFGKNSIGGRGGTVLFVTNLNDSGAGSLRAAVEATGARTVVFRVGGTITLTSGLNIENPFITIAGETAPGDGILLKGDIFQVNTHDVIVRHIRSRYGGSGEGTGDAMSVYASGQNAYNIIFDHVSVSWGGDENFNIRAATGFTAYDITLQNSLIGECNYGMLLFDGSKRVSVYRNLFAFNDDRNIRANYGINDVDFRMEMVNNLIYGFSGGGPTNPSNGLKYTVFNNKYKLSSQINASTTPVTVNASAIDAGANDSWTYAYIDGNIMPSGYSQNNSRVTPYLQGTPHTTTGLVESAIAASEIEASLLDNVGATYWSRDAVDTRIVNSYNAGNGTTSGLGTYPTIASGTAYTDTDNDGIEDSWEIEQFGNLTTNNNTDTDGDGYTNLEEFLHFKAGYVETVVNTLKKKEETFGFIN